MSASERLLQGLSLVDGDTKVRRVRVTGQQDNGV